MTGCRALRDKLLRLADRQLAEHAVAHDLAGALRCDCCGVLYWVPCPLRCTSIPAVCTVTTLIRVVARSIGKVVLRNEYKPCT